MLYDEQLSRLAVASSPFEYDRSGNRVEFDPCQLFDLVIALMHRCAAVRGGTGAHRGLIVITGQAESLVLTDRSGRPVRPGLSWLDSRAEAQASEMKNEFGAASAFSITGEPEPSATWPAAKLRWLAEHEPQTLRDADAVLMVKDDLIGRLTGERVGEMTTRGFTYFYDVNRATYWKEMLEFCSIEQAQLPALVAPGTDVGGVRDEVLPLLPPAVSYRVNVGALDHFCAMVGTGSYEPNVVSESSGTVLSLSMLTQGWTFDAARKISFHSGLRPGEIVLFNGVDSGGVALEWFRLNGLGGMDYPDLELALRGRSRRDPPMFLPYLTGVNPPDFFRNAKGAFLELDLSHDRIDMAFAVEEGIAHLLRRNVDYLGTQGSVDEIVSTGGGSASPFWNQLKADVCGVDVVVPNEQEATCRGAAALALVAAGGIETLAVAATLNQPGVTNYVATDAAWHQERYGRFETYLSRLYEN